MNPTKNTPLSMGKAAILVMRTEVADDEGPERLMSAFGPDKWGRLVALKDRYDPDNLFRRNQNIAPAAAAMA